MLLNKRTANYQDLLKTIAVIVMVFDHIGLFIYPNIMIFRVIGRVAMPLFCFFAGYNFHNKPKHKIIIWGILLEIYTVVLLKQFVTFNILVPIYLGQWYIYYFQNDLKKFFYSGYCHIAVLGFLWCITWPLIDYGTIVIAVMILGYIAKHDSLHLRSCSFIIIIISLLHTITTFGFYFSSLQMILVCILLLITYILIILRDFNDKIFVNLTWISRNALYIYLMHLVIIEYIFMNKHWL